MSLTSIFRFDVAETGSTKLRENILHLEQYGVESLQRVKLFQFFASGSKCLENGP
jgi:hypothetical protein